MRPRAHQHGFTLVEVLVALALSGLVALLLFDGLRIATMGLDRLSDRAQRLEARRSLEELLRRQVGSAFTAALGPNEPALIGHAADMQFLTLGEDAGAGLYRVQLGFETAGGERQLVLTRRIIGVAGDKGLERSVLDRRLRSFRIAYYGAPTPNDEPQWHDRWEGPRFPPRLVRITIDTGDGLDRPPITIRLWTAPG
jgi:general secretion pathway protein J